VDSPSQFDERMDEGFQYMVTPLVFDLSLEVDSSGYQIANVYGTTDEAASTGEVLNVKTLFPSRSEGGKTKGGVVLLQLAKTGESPELTLSASYENRDGQRFTSNRTITFEDQPAPYFESSGVRKAVALQRYATLLRNWAAFERAQSYGVTPPEPDAPDDDIVVRELGQWEQRSVPLGVSEPYDERIERFRTLLRQGFNVPLISRLVLGRYWRRADESTRDRFADVFEKFTVYRYAGLFDKYKGQELSVVGVSEDGRNGAMVTSRVKQPQGEAVRVRWRLRPASGDAAGSGDGDAEAAGQETDRPKGLTVEGDGPRWKVVDIVVEGVSMIVTQRDEFGSIARRQGVDGLIKALKNKVAQFRQDGPPDPPEVVKQGEG